MIIHRRDFEIGGWLYEPDDGFDQPRIHVLKNWRDYDNSPITCCDENRFEYLLWDAEEQLEANKLFYIPPTSDYDEFMKQIMVCNLKYDSKFK